MKKFMENRKYVIALSVFIYVAVSAFFVIMSYGVYNVDEFYSLGSADLEFDTIYDRSVYMNGLVRLFSSLFGRSYYVFRMIPELIGAVSYGCALYLMSKLCKKNSSILIGSLAVTFNALILFNHIYVRHYAVQELVYMIGLFFVYKYVKSTNKLKIAYLLIFVVIAKKYRIYTGDESGMALYAISLIMCIMAVLSKWLPKILYNKYIWIVAIIGWSILEEFVILLKKQMIHYSQDSILEWIHYVLSFYQTDMFTYFLFLLFVDLVVVIAIVTTFFRLVKVKFEDKQDLFLLVYICLPIIAYFSFFFNNNLLRTFIPYMTAGIVLLAYFLDGIAGKKKIGLGVLVALNTIFSFYPFPQGLVEFWSDPRVGEEIYSRDYQTWLDEARAAEQEGYEIIPMLTLTHEEHYFDIDAEISLTILDEDNNLIHEDDELESMLSQLMESGEKYVLIVDPLGKDALVRIGIYDYLKETYKHSLYDDRLYEEGLSIFYIE